MAKNSTCACGADLTVVSGHVYVDESNYAINASAPVQCLPCYAEQHLRRSEGHEILYSADAMALLASDVGRYPRSRYVVVRRDGEIILYR
jgi:hypothetical protein